MPTSFCEKRMIAFHSYEATYNSYCDALRREKNNIRMKTGVVRFAHESTRTHGNLAFGENILALRLENASLRESLSDLRAGYANPFRALCARKHPNTRESRLWREFARSPPGECLAAQAALRSPSGKCEPSEASLRLDSPGEIPRMGRQKKNKVQRCCTLFFFW